MRLDPERFAAVVAGTIKSAIAGVAEQVKGVVERVKALEDRGSVAGKDGPRGPMGEPGLNGRDGIDGKDGLGFDDLAGEYDEHGRLFLTCVRGDVVKRWRVPGVVDRGVYKAGEVYEHGDGVSWGGDFWIAQKATRATPGTEKDGTDRSWRLAVRRGAEGKVGKAGPAGTQGLRGPQGERGPSGY